MNAYIIGRIDDKGCFSPLWAYDNAESAIEDIGKDETKKVIIVKYYAKKLQALQNE